ncbi:HTH-type transcriptional activator IlvY [Alginatibacterium sediminis]|uniref:HTH-type transcriptional activator IlvY n=1 Tax=Alginatibacterium sediminis TaxID=2164068 RepID=A0A420ELQ7_9ALTE|nr:HTH-type transcriptional activator IlvY [Alginatibacterium sediminis]RKF21534.1 HTH-type transcriptional activator IlvY [Alginatibacterium sediminis]
MDARSIELFLHLSHSLHYAKTSKAMHVTPSTLSRVIQRLEQEMGAEFFVRDKRSVSLTSAGGRFRSFAELWLEQWRGLQTEFSNKQHSLSGELKVYCSVTASYSHLPEILDKYRIVCPNADIKLVTGDVALAIDKVADGEVDIALAARPEQLPLSMAFASIAKVPLSIIAPMVNCASRRLLDTKPIDWSQIPFILPEHGPAKLRFERWFQAMRIEPNVYATVVGHEAIVSMVALGSGVGIAPQVVLENSPVRDRVQSLNLGLELEPFDLGIAVLSRRLHEPLVQKFWQIAAPSH